MVFKVLQTYSDGRVVCRIDLTAPGQADPEHPAPVLNLSAGHTDGATPAASAAPTTTANDDGLPIAVGMTGAVLGLAGLVLGALALARARRTVAAAATVAERQTSPADS